MNASRTHDRRRATVLLMVVSLLALLFVIVVGFLSLARFERLSFQDVQRGNQVERVVQAVNQLVLSEMRSQWTDPNGLVLPGAPSARAQVTWEDIPGYRGARYQASLDPVADPNALLDPNNTLDLPPPYDLLARTRYAAVTSLSGTDRPLQPRIVDLMLDGDPNDRYFRRSDVIANARSAFMDADGDGVPDSGLLAGAAATHLANAIAQRPARLPGLSFTPHRMVKDPGEQEYDNYLLWKRFEETARYEVAVRVVPHGGMVALDAANDPNGNAPWNREFVTAMFNSLRRDSNSLRSDAHALFDDLKAEAAAVEALLRRRGGLMPSWAPAEAGKPRDPNWARVPEVLRQLERTFPVTLDIGRRGGFGPGLNRRESWQRFNLGEEDSLQAGIRTWFPAARVNATVFNRGISGSDHVSNYDRRHLLTALSTSDELARRLAGDATGGNLGLRHGQRKFYLGRVAEAFNAQGYFDQVRGRQIIDELANYYRDMLGGHEFDPNELPPDADDVTEQAYMLAVNTVGFAAPRRPNNAAVAPGFVDVPSSKEVNGKTYGGYGPQPYITQVIVYNSEEDPNQGEDLAALVELYNPNEPTSAVGPDEHALYAPQFAITLNGQDPQFGIILDSSLPSNRIFTWPDPAQPRRLPGRRFFSVAIRGGGGNTVLENMTSTDDPSRTVVHGKVDDYKVELKGVSGDELTVDLWRASSTGWFLVDRVELRADKTADYWEVVWRDCSSELYFGHDPAFPDRRARWRMVTAWERDDRHYRRAGGTGNPLDRPIGQSVQVRIRETFSTAQPDDVTPATRDDAAARALQFGPTVPLYTMNAMPLPLNQRNTLRIHGAPRPASFPTPGFLLFVPRFSHVRTGAVVRSAGMILRDAWEKDGEPAIASLPADFGHMPVFDNGQKARSGSSYFDNSQAGKLPWGLLVFDYFTTLNPDTPGLDPDRVPGRININAAPWFVLAQLPIIGPSPQTGLAPLSAAASPAFRDPNAGILFGSDSDLAISGPRFIGDSRNLFGAPATRSIPAYDSQAGWWRLGPWLAQSLAAYRDRLAYLATNVSGSMYVDAFRRNDEQQLTYQYRSPQLYGQDPNNPAVRGAGAGSHYGFLSIGEVANVLGFDSTPPASLASGFAAPPAFNDPNNVLGSNLLPMHGDFMKAVALTALLDSHFLTTRGNTFTVYVSVMDRENPQASVRSQLTVDRANLLPRLVQVDTNNDGVVDYTTTIQSQALPAVIAERQAGYYNARYDD